MRTTGTSRTTNQKQIQYSSESQFEVNLSIFGQILRNTPLFYLILNTYYLTDKFPRETKCKLF